MRLLEVEGSKGKSEGRSLVNMKHCTPDRLKDHKDWRSWRSIVEDYCEETFKGMKRTLEWVKDEKDKTDLSLFPEDHGDKAEMCWRFLKKHFEGDIGASVDSAPRTQRP